VAVTGIRWAPNEGFDIHVLRGTTSRRLDEILELVRDGGQDPVLASAQNLPADVDGVKFEPNFFGASQVGAVAGHELEVNTKTGEVKAFSNPPTPPDPKIRNFVIEARVSVRQGGTTKEFVIPVRVHVHGEVTELWLTPSPLTIHKEADGERFSVLAAFDDQTVGDLTRMPGIAWDPQAPGNVDVNVASGELKVVGVPPVTANVTVHLPLSWGGRKATGTVKGLRPWDKHSAEERAATLVSGPGTKKLDEVPNILFLAEGWDNRNDYDVIARRIHEHLVKSGVPRLFHHLRGSINFWSAFLPSSAFGITTPYEVVAPGLGAMAQTASETPQPAKPGHGQAWGIRNLLYEVGLPIPADKLPGTGNFTVQYDRKIQDWQALYGPHITKTQVDLSLFLKWSDLAERRLGNEFDTPFGTIQGSRPNLHRPRSSAYIHYDPLRSDPKDFRKYIATLTAGKNGTLIGPAWDPGKKDSRLIVAVCAGFRYGGYSGRTATGSIRSHAFSFKVMNLAAGSMQTILVPEPLQRDKSGKPKIVFPMTIGVIIHELGHRFDLGEEYVEDRGTFPIGSSRDVALGQLQADKHVRDSSNKLDPDLIFWRWPRIKKAAVLAKVPLAIPPSPLTGFFILTLKKGQANRFKKGEIVFLRQRPLLRRRPVDPSNPNADRPIDALVSSPLLILDDPIGDQLSVFDQSGSVSLAQFGVPKHHESIIFLPVPDTLLVHEDVAAHIKQSGGPLNAPRRRSDRRCSSNRGELATNFPKNLKKPTPRHKAVGLFEGAEGFACGIHRGTGVCRMRGNHDPFCPVCSYLLLDRIDPSKHGSLDLDIQKDYPG
jgi:hypothetical protein